jgi:Secretion system C-terminal sorting domain
MKRIIILAIFLSFSNAIISQSWLCSNYHINFEDTSCLSQLSIDTLLYPNNNWQIGQPRKAVFDSAWSPPRAIVTDTLNYYSANNTSVFIVMNQVSDGFKYERAVSISGYYKVNSDSIHDYGLIEFSPDIGNTWIDLINDTLYKSYIDWYSKKPVLTGNSVGWQWFNVYIGKLGYLYNFELGDTVLYRFTFISDSIQDSLDGLMYDDFLFEDYFVGIEELAFNRIYSTAYPNPASNSLSIEFNNPEYLPFKLNIYDNMGRRVFNMDIVTSNKIEINFNGYQPGLYYYELMNINHRMKSDGKFIISEN